MSSLGVFIGNISRYTLGWVQRLLGGGELPSSKYKSFNGVIL